MSASKKPSAAENPRRPWTIEAVRSVSRLTSVTRASTMRTQVRATEALMVGASGVPRGGLPAAPQREEPDQHVVLLPGEALHGSIAGLRQDAVTDGALEVRRDVRAPESLEHRRHGIHQMLHEVPDAARA